MSEPLNPMFLEGPHSGRRMASPRGTEITVAVERFLGPGGLGAAVPEMLTESVRHFRAHPVHLGPLREHGETWFWVPVEHKGRPIVYVLERLIAGFRPALADEPRGARLDRLEREITETLHHRP